MRTHGVAWALLAALIIFTAGIGIAAAAVYEQVEIWCADLPEVDNTDAFTLAEPSKVYAADGTTLLAEFQIEYRIPLDSLSEVSGWMVQATIDTEDTRFYSHDGVDYWGLVRAFINNITGGEVQGASTITQQLVKNTLLSAEATEMTLRRKVREASLALEMEDVYSKDEILLMYLNTINYGDGCYGVEAAARHYFNKPAKELTMLEAATLAGIPQSPANLNPVDNPDACLDRRNDVLRRMRVAGTITAEEYASAITAPLDLDVQHDDSYNGILLYPYFTSYVRDQLLQTYSTSEIFAGGLTIYTTLDVRAQEAAEKACRDNYYRISNGLEYAFVAVDPRDGHIIAMVGGKDFFTDQFNIATTKGRPTGSTFKMFTLVTAIEQGINPSTLVDCSTPVVVSTAQGKHEINNMNKIDYGVVSIATATAWSCNTGFVRLMLKVTAHAVIETAKRMGVTAALPEVPTLTLGVADITPLEMASAYGVLATYGVRYDHICITRIDDRNGSTIYLAEEEGVRVLTESVAGATTTVLKGVVAPGGTATAIKLFDRRDVAAKTGSSDDWKDRWTVAYTPSVSVACWLGDRANKLSWWGANATNYVVNDFLNSWLAGTPYEKFPKYTNPPYDNPYNQEQNIELGKSELQKAPNVVGKKLKTALKELDGWPVVYVQDWNDEKPKDEVVEQEIDEKHKQIVLYVSKGKNPNPKTATVTFNLRGGTLDGKTGTFTMEVKLEEKLVFPAAPSKDGYYFVSWSSKGYQPGDELSITGDMTFSAIWEEVPPEFFTVTFVDDDGTVISSTEYVSGTPASSIVVPANPTKNPDGAYTYAFSHWTPALSDVTKNITYRAVYNATPVEGEPDPGPGGGGGGGDNPGPGDDPGTGGEGGGEGGDEPTPGPAPTPEGTGEGA